MFRETSDANRQVFEFGEVELETADDGTLGQGYTATATPGESAGNIDYIFASVGVVVDTISWELRDGRRICSLRFTLSISSSVAFRLSSCIVTCKLGCSTPRSDSASGGIKPLRFYDFAPKKLDRRNPTSATINTGIDIGPEIQVPMGFGFKLVSWKRAKTFTRESGSDFKIDRTSSIPKLAESEFDTLTLRSTANEYQREGLQQTFEVDAIVEHHDEEFWIDFDINPKFGFNTMIKHPRKILKAGTSLVSRRKFIPITTQ